jgi:hypothetical protein
MTIHYSPVLAWRGPVLAWRGPVLAWRGLLGYSQHFPTHPIRQSISTCQRGDINNLISVSLSIFPREGLTPPTPTASNLTTKNNLFRYFRGDSIIETPLSSILKPIRSAPTTTRPSYVLRVAANRSSGVGNGIPSPGRPDNTRCV